MIKQNFKLGILGGGQLGKMLIQAASKWNIEIHVLDPDENCCSSNICHFFKKGSFKDYETVYNFGKTVDLLTFEIEHVNTKALKKLEDLGKKIYPQSNALDIIKDKGLQKDFYKNHKIPTSSFHLFSSKKEVLTALSKKIIKLPFVQKSRTEGYDGKGVQTVKSEIDLNSLFDTPCIIEELIPIEKELAVIVSRNNNGETKSFPTVEMEFSDDANLVEQLICPSSISTKDDEKTRSIAIEIINKLGMVGNLAVEFFLTKKGEILVNEAAPRPHNSGHHTIESNYTSQFEQHLRAILNLPLGSTKLISPSVMINLLGHPNYEGSAKYTNLNSCLELDQVYVHIYGKKITKPYRKMGHVTVMDNTIEKAKAKATFIKNNLTVISNEK
jgi:5-(carboxyamino)imidazole ribonucleotide synthase